jgi:SagB-type dehydrogenase family enzyme
VQLPLTANGKVDRRALAVSHRESPSSAGPEASNADLDRVAGVVRGASRIPIPSVNSDLLGLGLDSIDLIRIANALDTALGFRPDLETLYASPTIRTIAESRPGRSDVASEPAIHDSTGEAVLLLTDDLPAASMFASRRSVRRFTLRPVSTSALSGLLDALRVRPDGTRSYGSASAFYPVRTYVSVKPGRVGGVDAGSYRYDPVRHALHSVSPDRPARAFFAPSNTPAFEEAAFVFFLVAELAALEERYGSRGAHLATVEAGLMAQTLDIAAPACGLGICQIGSANEAAIGSLLGLGPRDRFVHALFAGAPDGEASGTNEMGEEARLRRHIERVGRLSAEETAVLSNAYRRGS